MKRRVSALVVVASADAALLERVAERVRSEGHVAYCARTAAGCLRVATATAPDAVLIDGHFPPSLERMLRAHPATATAEIVRLPENGGSVPHATVPIFQRLHALWAT